MNMGVYPNIARACQLIALDNGGINRTRGALAQVRECERWLEDRAQFQFPNVDEIDAWLATLTDDQLDAVCCGGQGEPEQVAAMVGAPPFTDELLTTYFEDVC
jgi:hypothetical protein